MSKESLYKLAACHYWIKDAKFLSIRRGGDFIRAMYSTLDTLVTTLVQHANPEAFKGVEGHAQPMRVGSETYRTTLHYNYNLATTYHEFTLICRLLNGQHYRATKQIPEHALQHLGVQ